MGQQGLWSQERAGPFVAAIGGGRGPRLRDVGHRRADCDSGRRDRQDSGHLRERVNERVRSWSPTTRPCWSLGTRRSRLPDFRRVGTYVWSNTQASNSDWGWQGDTRSIVACDADLGKAAVEDTSRPWRPCSLAANADSIVFHDGTEAGLSGSHTGKLKWEGRGNAAQDAGATAIPARAC